MHQCAKLKFFMLILISKYHFNVELSINSFLQFYYSVNTGGNEQGAEGGGVHLEFKIFEVKIIHKYKDFHRSSKVISRIPKYFPESKVPS